MSDALKKTVRCGMYIVAATFISSCASQPARMETIENKVQAEDTAQRCTWKTSDLSQNVVAATKIAGDKLLEAAGWSLDELFSRVAAGDSVAQIELGLRYANGTNLPLNPERAINLFAAAAKQGNPDGLFFLGSAYSNGLGIAKNDGIAVMIWEEAARQAHPLSQYWLGFMVANGRGGVEANWCAAMPLFEAAANQDVPDAAFMLGIAYNNGYIDLPDYKQAATWYRRATAQQLNQKAQYNLRLLIEKYLVDWQEGDPGVAPPPKPLEVPTIEFKDK